MAKPSKNFNEKGYHKMLQLLPGGYNKDDFDAMSTILQAGIDSVCDGVCESCTFDRACADVLRVAVFARQKANSYTEND